MWRASDLQVSPKYPHLGASPDGLLTCTCCGDGLLEMKCPYRLCHTTLNSAGKDFYLKHTPDDQLPVFVGMNAFLWILAHILSWRLPHFPCTDLVLQNLVVTSTEARQKSVSVKVLLNLCGKMIETVMQQDDHIGVQTIEVTSTGAVLPQ